MQLTEQQFCADWVARMGELTPLTTATVLQYLNLRAQADARPCQYPNCGCDSRAKCKSLFTGAPASPKEASAPGLSPDQWDAVKHAIELVRGHQSAEDFEWVADGLESILTRASAATASLDARIEELRKGLFEARDALAYAADLLPQRFQAKDHRFFLAAIERANNILSGANNG